MVGILTLTIFDAGLRAPAAPGSILAVLAQTPGDSFVGCHPLGPARGRDVVRRRLDHPAGRAGSEDEGDLAAATASMEAMKGKKSRSPACSPAARRPTATDEASRGRGPDKPIHNIVFACDAGMGSSAMGASILRNKVKKAGFDDVTVVNVAIANLTDDIDLVVTHQDLTRAQGQDAERPARVGRQLHEQPEVRRHRGGAEAHQRRSGHRRAELTPPVGGHDRMFDVAAPTTSDRQRSRRHE